MEAKFIYVFSQEKYEKLYSLGYSCVKKDDKNNIFVFENKPEVILLFNKEDFVYSNTLTF